MQQRNFPQVYSVLALLLASEGKKIGLIPQNITAVFNSDSE